MAPYGHIVWPLTSNEILINIINISTFKILDEWMKSWGIVFSLSRFPFPPSFLSPVRWGKENLPIIVNHRFPITLPRLFMPTSLPSSCSSLFLRFFFIFSFVRQEEHEVWRRDSTYMRNLTFDALVEFLTCHSLTNDNYGTTGRRIVSFYERSLVLSGTWCLVYMNVTRGFCVRCALRRISVE